jgi:hypothetical protein
VTTEFKSGQSIARGVVESIDDRELVLAVPGSAYRLHLAPAGPISTPVGQRIRGTIHARALRVHPAKAGGRFIEPVWGQPRIVQGIVCGTEDKRLLVDVSVPMWVTLGEGQDAADFEHGQMVNFYVQSGATFREE